jgi:hypothetical protein
MLAEVGDSPLSLSQAVLGQLRRLDSLLCERARALRTQHLDEAADLRGLFISDQEFEELLTRPFGQTLLDSPSPWPPSQQPQAANGLARFLQQFSLSPFEADVLLLGLLPEIDLKYERIYAFLQDDVTSRRPTCDLSLALFCDSLLERLLRRQAFEAHMPLRRYGLIELRPREGHGGLLASTITVAPRVVAHLLGLPASQFRPTGSLAHPTLRDIPSSWHDDLAAVTDCLAELGIGQAWVLITTADRRTALETATHLCQKLGWPLLELDATSLGPEAERQREVMGDAVREAMLQEASLLIHLPRPYESVEEPASTALPAMLSTHLAGLARPVFFAGERLDERMPAPLEGTRVLRLTLHPPDYAHRLAIWSRATDDISVERGALDAVAGRFRLSADQVQRAAGIARDVAWQRDQGDAVATFADLASAARIVSSGSLGRLAKRIGIRHTWDDLVLPPDRVAQLREMCDQFIYRPLVFDTWGFGKRSSLGAGLSALFAGPSGTGKTMAAEVIAGELSLDLYKIDLAGVVSKYIGETEKNLERIFEMACDSNAILLFDEADALFGKRSETKDAHDRYANIEISYLLQKIEEYDGVVILTSNLRQNLDEAFLRRLQFTVEFPMPDEEARLAIWQRTLPEAAPVEPNVDLEEMSRRYRFSGGSIRNVLVNAAFLAARDGQILGMEHLLWAARREFQKLGKLVDEAQFIREPGRLTPWTGDAIYGAR